MSCFHRSRRLFIKNSFTIWYLLTEQISKINCPINWFTTQPLIEGYKLSRMRDATSWRGYFLAEQFHIFEGTTTYLYNPIKSNLCCLRWTGSRVRKVRSKTEYPRSLLAVVSPSVSKFSKYYSPTLALALTSYCHFGIVGACAWFKLGNGGWKAGLKRSVP